MVPSNVANSSLLWRFPRHHCPRPGHPNARQRLGKCRQPFRNPRQRLRNPRQPLRNTRQWLRNHKPCAKTAANRFARPANRFASTNLRSQAQTFAPKHKPLFPSANLCSQAQTFALAGASPLQKGYPPTTASSRSRSSMASVAFFRTLKAFVAVAFSQRGTELIHGFPHEPPQAERRAPLLRTALDARKPLF